MSQVEDGPPLAPEERVALIHRVLTHGRAYPLEYAILVTDRRSIFIRQEKTRSGFVLRGEMRHGTALVTDVVPKTLKDYEGGSLDSLSTTTGNFAISHGAVVSFEMRRDEPEFQRRDFFVWLTMRRQGEIFQVYSFVMDWRRSSGARERVNFYAVPLGMYFKPRRMTQTRETILREYAQDVAETFGRVLPASALTASPLGR